MDVYIPLGAIVVKITTDVIRWLWYGFQKYILRRPEDKIVPLKGRAAQLSVVFVLSAMFAWQVLTASNQSWDLETWGRLTLWVYAGAIGSHESLNAVIKDLRDKVTSHQEVIRKKVVGL